jgi:NADH:ubiquinone oxidoreductase subunit E
MQSDVVGAIGDEVAPAMLPSRTARDIGDRVFRALIASGEDELTPELLDGIAAEMECPKAHVYAAALTTWRPFAVDHAVRFAICAGQCQLVGALDLMEHLLRRRDQRTASGLPTFDLLPRGCLNGCGRGPTVYVMTREGVSGMAHTTAAQIDEVLEQLDEAKAWG